MAGLRAPKGRHLAALAVSMDLGDEGTVELRLLVTPPSVAQQAQQVAIRLLEPEQGAVKALKARLLSAAQGFNERRTRQVHGGGPQQGEVDYAAAMQASLDAAALGSGARVYLHLRKQDEQAQLHPISMCSFQRMLRVMEELRR